MRKTDVFKRNVNKKVVNFLQLLFVELMNFAPSGRKERFFHERFCLTKKRFCGMIIISKWGEVCPCVGGLNAFAPFFGFFACVLLCRGSRKNLSCVRVRALFVPMPERRLLLWRWLQDQKGENPIISVCRRKSK